MLTTALAVSGLVYIWAATRGLRAVVYVLKPGTMALILALAALLLVVSALFYRQIARGIQKRGKRNLLGPVPPGLRRCWRLALFYLGRLFGLESVCLSPSGASSARNGHLLCGPVLLRIIPVVCRQTGRVV